MPSGRPLNTADRERLKELWQDPNISRSQAAEMLGLAYDTMKKWAREMGLPRRNTHDTGSAIKKTEIALRQELTPWPEGVIFEDHPHAGTSRDYGARGRRVYGRWPVRTYERWGERQI